jgi:valyl-tRNA synthetase
MSLPNGPYNASDTEKEILDFWISNQFYKPEYLPAENRVQTTDEMKRDGRIPWSLICPPPNAYGRPHIGNISGYAYQDAMARYQRMNGKKVLVLPGKDHAGLEGEGVFVRDVLEKKGIYKFDLSREEFYQMIWDFNMENREKALRDEKEIGLSADFERDRFTLDPEIVQIVLTTFIEMYKENMIYKGVRIVNWDPKARSVVADNQCVRKEREGKLYKIVYKIKDGKNNYKLLEYFEGLSQNLLHTSTGFLTNKAPSEHPNNLISLIIYEGQDKASNYVFEKNLPTNVQRSLGKPIGILEGAEIDSNDNTDIKHTPLLKIVYTNFDSERLCIEEGQKIDIDFLFDTSNFIAKRSMGKVIFENSEFEEIYRKFQELFNSFIIVATTRPETMFGDTAVAVHPDDERYKNLIGKKVLIPLTNREIPIISSPRVEKEFGTGCLKITPAHAQDDFQIMNEWNQEQLRMNNEELIIGYVNIINKDLKLVGPVPENVKGMKYNQALPIILEDLKKEGLLVGEESITQNILVAERTGAVIEPIMSSQWFISIDKIRQPVIDMVREGKVKIHPKNMEDKFFFWMENLRDWAISRSLWWGYRMPVWYAGEVSEEINGDGQIQSLIRIDGNLVPLNGSNSEHMRVQLESPGEGWIQDENVFDTWFSSGQWPFATLTAENLMDTFYPTDVMETGFDILENWVSRMMMFSWFKLKEIPFKDVYLHGLVLGKDGQKMSKSKGNLVDIDQARADFGTDAIRMVYFYQNKAGASYSFSPDKLKNFKQFMNKIWNASRFVLMNVPSDFELKVIEYNSPLSKEIFEHTTQLKEKITKNIEDFEFGHATDSLYQEFWHTYCDIYIERAKEFIKEDSTKSMEERSEVLNVMVFSLREYLKMLHPFTPFITERVWKEIPHQEGDHESLMYSSWN